jgi:hypothetical protein
MLSVTSRLTIALLILFSVLLSNTAVVALPFVATLSIAALSATTTRDNNDSIKETELINSDNSEETSDAFTLLAHAMSPFFASSSSSLSSKQNLVNIFHSLASSQQTLKALDGISHEAYQRTHSSSSEAIIEDTSIRGRARRSAARASATADGLGACEFCEYIMMMMMINSSGNLSRSKDAFGSIIVDDAAQSAALDGILTGGREVLLNATDTIVLDETLEIKLSMLVLHEPAYQGGAGIHHGGIQGVSPEHQATGRLIVIIGDSAIDQMDKTVQLLTKSEPLSVSLPTRATEILSEPLLTAWVQPHLYRAAGKVLQRIQPQLEKLNATSASKQPAIHFVGQSLAGGVAGIAASILHGNLPMPSLRKRDRKSGKRQEKSTPEKIEITGMGNHQTSAVTIGAPPCISANVASPYITSILFGDDIVCRTSKQSMDRLLQRIERVQKSGVVGRQLNRFTDTFSLATSSLLTRSSNSKQLSLPGRAFLIRPRRLENHCSMHEVTASQLVKQKREALRAAVLWQLNDIVLTKSLWKHHDLDSYIQGLDRVQLRSVVASEEGDKEGELVSQGEDGVAGEEGGDDDDGDEHEETKDSQNSEGSDDGESDDNEE